MPAFYGNQKKVVNLSLYYKKRSSLIRRKVDWSDSKKGIKLIALRDKKRKNTAQIVLAGPKFLNFFTICYDAQEKLSFF